MVCMIDDIVSISSRSSTSDRRFKSIMHISMHDGMADHGFSSSLLHGSPSPNDYVFKKAQYGDVD